MTPPRLRKAGAGGKDRGVQLEMPGGPGSAPQVAAVREGLLALRAQLDDLLAQVERLHQPRRRWSARR